VTARFCEEAPTSCVIMGLSLAHPSLDSIRWHDPLSRSDQSFELWGPASSPASRMVSTSPSIHSFRGTPSALAVAADARAPLAGAGSAVPCRARTVKRNFVRKQLPIASGWRTSRMLEAGRDGGILPSCSTRTPARACAGRWPSTSVSSWCSRRLTWRSTTAALLRGS
jgi:hypothetical protein